jgi:hypothetical protein
MDEVEPSLPTALYHYFISEKQNLSSHRLRPSFSNIHENQETSNITSLHTTHYTRYSLQVFPPNLHFLHTNSFGDFDCFDILYGLVCAAYINAGVCLEWRRYNEMRDSLMHFYFLCNIIMEKRERSLCGCSLSFSLSDGQTHVLFFDQFKYGNQNTNRLVNRLKVLHYAHVYVT